MSKAAALVVATPSLVNPQRVPENCQIVLYLGDSFYHRFKEQRDNEDFKLWADPGKTIFYSSSRWLRFSDIDLLFYRSDSLVLIVTEDSSSVGWFRDETELDYLGPEVDIVPLIPGSECVCIRNLRNLLLLSDPQRIRSRVDKVLLKAFGPPGDNVYDRCARQTASDMLTSYIFLNGWRSMR